MTVRPIRLVGDPVLRTVAAPITSVDDGVRALVADLLDTVREPGRAGLAAPQIGIGLAAFSYNVEGRLGYVLNPSLVRTEGTQAGTEGCLSLPGEWFDLDRPAFAEVRGTDLDGRDVVVSGEGLMARCLVHEVDHLDGHVFIDRLEGGERRKAMRAVARMR